MAKIDRSRSDPIRIQSERVIVKKIFLLLSIDKIVIKLKMITLKIVDQIKKSLSELK